MEQAALDAVIASEHWRDETAAEGATISVAGGNTLDASRPEGQTGMPAAARKGLVEGAKTCTK